MVGFWKMGNIPVEKKRRIRQDLKKWEYTRRKRVKNTAGFKKSGNIPVEKE